MEGQNYSVKERLEQLEALMGKYTAAKTFAWLFPAVWTAA